MVKRTGCILTVTAAVLVLASVVYIVQKPSYDEALRQYDLMTRDAGLSSPRSSPQ